MASIFTYDPDPPKVSSPWTKHHSDSLKKSASVFTAKTNYDDKHDHLSEYGITKLEAEPQDGPIEYKLHLLLRPRRNFSYMSIPQIKSKSSNASPKLGQSAKLPATAASPQPRQHRLQHLTTQLLWRMQQSSPYHAARTKELVVPRFPDDNVDLDSTLQLAPLTPGLEESGGALYEIGVSDDGTLVGLTKDEMDESFTTLRIMAASLGCTVEVIRMVVVGDCEWIESVDLVDAGDTSVRRVLMKDKLYVAEAMVTPSFRQTEDQQNRSINEQKDTLTQKRLRRDFEIQSRAKSTTSQLRITLTGPTTSGKSSLLGTLSTGTLDNGRGKSRLSLLKHRHELMSGVTSSVAQELIGYRDSTILNYSQPDIESWIDIHDQTQDGRLLFVTDSGGHPRYRRTVLRGLMNWAPHWNILCIAADDSEQNSSTYRSISEDISVETAHVDLVKAHLTLSLCLDVPMAVVITKMDVASKTGLQKTLMKVLSAIKEAGRVPKILQPNQKEHKGLPEIPDDDQSKVKSIIEALEQAEGLTMIVPIVLTSALNGTGIGLVHALFQSLPVPPAPTSHGFVGAALNPEQPKSLFHIDDTYNLPISQGNLANNASSGNNGVIVSGHIRFGSLTVGESIVVGPFPPEDEDGKIYGPEDRPTPSSFDLPISQPASAELARITVKNAISASDVAGQWLKAEVVSIRNLRLPVRTLDPDQAGSIGLVLDLGRETSPYEMPRIRRGMVIAVLPQHMLDTGLSLQAASGFTASFKDFNTQTLTVGVLVNVYIASIRAAARISRIRQLGQNDPEAMAIEDTGSLSLSTKIEADDEQDEKETGATEVTLELLHAREWIEMGSCVLVLEGGIQDKSGLEGHVGRVIELVD